MIEQVLPHIYHIHVPLPRNPLRELNSYLIKGDGRNLLIDTGFRQVACQKALLAALQELGVRREDTDVLLTHRHSDHAGLADVFSGDDRTIYVGEIERESFQQPLRNQLRKAHDDRLLAEGLPTDVFTSQEYRNPAHYTAIPDSVYKYTDLADGDVLEIAGYRLKAILTPGHTPGHMCFWMEEQGAMFLGDHVLFDITPNITAWTELPDALGTYLESLKAIRSYDVEISLPGHRATGNFKQRVDELLLHHEQRLDETRRIVREHPGLTAHDIAGKMTWHIRCSSWEDFPPGQKWFAVGECLSHLDRLKILGEIRSEVRDGLVYYFPA